MKHVMAGVVCLAILAAIVMSGCQQKNNTSSSSNAPTKPSAGVPAGVTPGAHTTVTTTPQTVPGYGTGSPQMKPQPAAPTPVTDPNLLRAQKAGGQAPAPTPGGK